MARFSPMAMFLFLLAVGLAPADAQIIRAASIGCNFDIARHGEGLINLPERKWLEFVTSEIARANKATPDSLKLIEPSILDEIKKSGFIERVQ